MCIVREPSVPKRDRDGKPILSYPKLMIVGFTSIPEWSQGYIGLWQPLFHAGRTRLKVA
jgi:hypothetical protein